MTLPIPFPFLYAVIPVKDQLAYTRPLVEELLRQDEAFRIFLLDNGSTDGTLDWARNLAKNWQPWSARFRVDSLPGLNLHQMWNYGLNAAARCEKGNTHSIALLNNDLRIGPAFLSQLDRALRLDDRIGVAGACYDARHWTEHATVQLVEGVCAGRYDGTGGLPGFAMMLRGEDGHRFPEELHWWYGDTDLVRTMTERARLCVIARHATCEHLDGGGRTGKWSSPEMQALLRADREWYEAKWRGMPA